ncbi:unnamed protein product [Paramecium primaurelia]|uniref:Uncharacterized protein n=1 Tax=Paramecium primaurelia TaxID=5886 RepID=A0A8S1KE50_PARPR|nr:unnamed protein product [Paramecium primaurelia]
MNNTRPSQLPAAKATPSQLPQSGQLIPEGYQPTVGWVPASSQIQPGIMNQAIPIQQTGLITNPQYFQQQAYAQQPLIQSNGPVVTQGNVIKGESRIEYVPYTKEVTEYVTQEVVEYVPRERKITDYYAVEYVTEHIPQVIQEKYIEYVPVETIKERTEYQAVTRQSVIQQPIDYQQVQTTQQYQVPAQIQYATTTTNQYIPSTQNQFTTVPVTTSQYIPQQVTYGQIPATTTTYGQLPATTTTYGQLSATTAAYGQLPSQVTYGQQPVTTTTAYGQLPSTTTQAYGQLPSNAYGQVTTTTQQYSTGWQQVFPSAAGNVQQPQFQQQQPQQAMQRPGQSPKYQ